MANVCQASFAAIKAKQTKTEHFGFLHLLLLAPLAAHIHFCEQAGRSCSACLPTKYLHHSDSKAPTQNLATPQHQTTTKHQPFLTQIRSPDKDQLPAPQRSHTSTAMSDAADRDHAPSSETTLSPLYGILCTEKSYLFACRRLVNTDHANFLARRLLFPRFPTELVDQVADEIFDLAEEDTRHAWKALANKPNHRFERFHCARHASLLRQEREPNGDDSHILQTLVQVAKPYPVSGEDAGSRYIHISMGSEMPKLEMLVPGPQTVSTGGPPVRYANGAVTISCWPPSFAGKILSKQRVVCLGKARPTNDDDDDDDESEGGGESTVNTVMLLDGVEESMKLWDPEVMRKFVEELNLKVVAIAGESESELKPRLRLMQRVVWMS